MQKGVTLNNGFFLRWGVVIFIVLLLLYYLYVLRQSKFDGGLLELPATLSTQVEISSRGGPVEWTTPLDGKCPLKPPDLQGQIEVTFAAPTLEEIAAANPNLASGGAFKPDCDTQNKVMILIPYKNRDEQLRIFLAHMHPIWQRQLIDYRVFLIEPQGAGKFNRAMLFNIGFAEAVKLYPFRCVILHDVDLLVENDYNLYSCPASPRHMSGYIDIWKYKIPYAAIFGGVSAIPRDQYELINGMSNLFFGWGGEDDDLHKRLVHHKLKITRYPAEISHLKMIKHTHEKGNKANPERFALLKHTIERLPYDGLNSLAYTLVATELAPLFTKFKVVYTEQAVRAAVRAKQSDLFKQGG